MISSSPEDAGGDNRSDGGCSDGVAAAVRAPSRDVVGCGGGGRGVLLSPWPAATSPLALMADVGDDGVVGGTTAAAMTVSPVVTEDGGVSIAEGVLGDDGRFGAGAGLVVTRGWRRTAGAPTEWERG